MEKILTVIDTFITALIKLKEEVVKIVDDYNLKIEAIAKDKEANILRSKELDKREEGIKSIEDVVALKAEAEAQLREASDLKTQLSRDRDAFNDYVSDENKKIKIAKEQNANESTQIQSEWLILRKEQDDLKKDKETWKLNIAKGIVEQADKR